MNDYWKGFFTCLVIVIVLNAVCGYLAYLLFREKP